MEKVIWAYHFRTNSNAPYATILTHSPSPTYCELTHYVEYSTTSAIANTRYSGFPKIADQFEDSYIYTSESFRPPLVSSSHTMMVKSSSILLLPQHNWFLVTVVIGILTIGSITTTTTRNVIFVNGAAVDPPIAEPIVEAINYTHQEDALQGFLATPSSSDGPFPAVIIIPYVASFLSL